MPAAKKAREKAEEKETGAGSVTVVMELDGKKLPLTPHEWLTLKERFAIRSLTGLPAEELWSFGVGETLGRDRIAVWWWIARSRDTGKDAIVPFALIEQELDQAAEQGHAIEVSLEDGATAEEAKDDPEA